jgi:hypothetical protein
MSRKPFTTKYDWNDFDNTFDLSEFQKYRIKTRYKKEITGFIQDIVDDSVKEKGRRRSELNAHNDPKNPFNLELGGEG